MGSSKYSGRKESGPIFKMSVTSRERGLEAKNNVNSGWSKYAGLSPVELSCVQFFAWTGHATVACNK